MCSFVICPVGHGQFVSFFDCFIVNNGKIWIYDVRHQIFTLSKLNCSNNGYVGNFKAFVVSNEKNDILITFGYVQAVVFMWY